jgi:Leucine-rich repeat (LRR) protein
MNATQTDEYTSQKNALLDLYDTTNGVDWRPCNWNNVSNLEICKWCGIVCENNFTNKVIELNLENNNLIGEIIDTIGDLIYLRKIRLSFNHIESIPSNLSNLNLSAFLIRNNLISNISMIDWSSFDNLRDFDISSNPIQSIPNSLFFLPLSILNLSFAQISSFPNDIYNKSTIKELIVKNNILGSDFPQTICSIEQLETIDLSFNYISQLPSNLLNCGNLKNLFLSHNLIEFVPQLQEGQVEILDLSFNQINVILFSFENVDIKRLILSNNTLEYVRPPKDIVSLSAQNNRIKNVSSLYPFFNKPSFCFMDVSYNELVGTFDTNIQNGYINLIGNENVSFNNFVFNEPNKIYQDPSNLESIYECQSVYADPLYNSFEEFGSTNSFIHLFKIEIYPQFFNYTNCKCAKGYYVPKIFFFFFKFFLKTFFFFVKFFI